MKLKTTTLALLALTATVGAQAHHSLLYTVRGPGQHATISGSSGTMFADLGGQDVAVVTPWPGASAETYLNQAAFNVVHGDKDLDAVMFQLALGQQIDALTLCGNDVSPRFRNHFISVKETVGTPGLTPVMTPGDVASPRPDGNYAYLIREDQIRSVFDIDPADPIDVDAVVQLDDGTLLLSLEHDVTMLGGLLAHDGDLLMIPTAYLMYDGCKVIDTMPSTGLIVADETIFDALVSASGVSDHLGNPVAAITDLDGIEVDPGGGTWIAQGLSGAFALPDLLFCGQRLQGGSVLTTQGGGAIAQLNGQPLGKPVPMPADGFELGLLPGTYPHVRPLDALAVLENGDPYRVLTDVSPAIVPAPVPVTIEWAGADPGGVVGLALSVGISMVGGNVPFLPIGAPGFGYYFLPMVGPGSPSLVAPLLSDGLGFGSIVVPPAMVMGVPAGVWLNVQTAAIKSGVLVIGGPALVQF